MSSESENEDPVNDLMAFALLIKDRPVIMSKGQTPDIKARKTMAYEELANASGLGKSQIQKRVQNMKTKVKAAYDPKTTGNRKPLPWMEVIKEILDRNQGNPTFHGVPGGIDLVQRGEWLTIRTRMIRIIIENDQITNNSLSTGAPLLMTAAEQDSPSTASSGQSTPVLPSTSTHFRPVQQAAKKFKPDPLQTPPVADGDLQNLSTAELQRIALQEQIRAFRVMREFYENKLNTPSPMQQFISTFNPIDTNPDLPPGPPAPGAEKRADDVKKSEI